MAPKPNTVKALKKAIRTTKSTKFVDQGAQLLHPALAPSRNGGHPMLETKRMPMKKRPKKMYC